jgi:hypothetical protein
MSHADQLIEVATELALEAKEEASKLERLLTELENRKREMEAHLLTGKMALERLSTFVSVRGDDLQCPRCWINREVSATLKSVTAGGQDQDSFRCTICQSEFALRT